MRMPNRIRRGTKEGAKIFIKRRRGGVSTPKPTSNKKSILGSKKKSKRTKKK